MLSYSPKVDLAGLEPAASAVQVRCSPELSYRPRVPPPSLAGGYSITLGQASTRPSVRCGPHLYERHSISPREKRKGPHRGPADRVERIQSVSQELRGCEQRRSQRPTAACWAFIKGDEGAGRYLSRLRRPALRLCTTLSLFTSGAPYWRSV